MDDENKEDLKLEFKFGEVVLWLLKMTGVFLVELVLLCVIRKGLFCLGFTVSFERIFTQVANIVASWAWPCCVFIIIYLFKGNLKGLVNVLCRFHNGKDDSMMPGTDRGRKEEDEEEVDEEDNQNSKDKRENPMEKLRKRLRESITFGHYVLDRLQREMQVLVSKNVRIFDAEDFDGGFRIRDVLYGVEIKWKPTERTLERTFEHFNKVYLSLTDSQRSRFRIILCINEGCIDDDKIERLRERYSVPISYRVFSFDPNNENEVNK